MNIFFFDVDGTLLSKGVNKSVSDKTIFAINELINNGHKVVIATGKSKKMIENDILQYLNINTLITNNGSIIYENKKKIYDRHITDDELNLIINFSKQNNYMLGLQEETSYYMLDINSNQKKYLELFNTVNLDLPKFRTRSYDNIYQCWIIGDLKNNDINNRIIPKFKQFLWHMT